MLHHCRIAACFVTLLASLPAAATSTLFTTRLNSINPGPVTAANLNAQTTGGTWSLNSGRGATYTIQETTAGADRALLADDADNSNAGTIQFASIVLNSPAVFSTNTVKVEFRTAPRRTGVGKALLYQFFDGNTLAASLEWDHSAQLSLNGAVGNSSFTFLNSWNVASSAVRDVTVAFAGNKVRIVFGGVLLHAPVLNSATRVTRIVVSSSSTAVESRGVFLDDITVTSIPAPPTLLTDPAFSELSYTPPNGSASVRLKGTPLTRYQFLADPKLDLANPDSNPLPLIAASQGTRAGDHVITDIAGHAVVQFDLGNGKTHFFWVEALGPVSSQVGNAVDVGTVLSNIPAKPGGFVTDWLLDSDIERPRPTSMVEVYNQLEVGSVRFPFGHLANNYLWTSPPYSQAVNGLTPRIASRSSAPAFWSWAVNPDNSFRKDLDFDEFIAQCRAANIEPVVVINVMAHKYNNGPTLAELREAAVEWVRYANVTRNYGVKYWQLGNEQENHPTLITLEEYSTIYGDFTAAMNAVDPTIRTGLAVINNTTWVRSIINAFPGRVDFVGCHQYQWSNWTVEQWRAVTDPVIPGVLNVAETIRTSPRPDAEIMVTEASAFGNWFDGSGQPDIMRALCFAEMLLHMTTLENFVHAHFWSTHSPWNGEDADGGLASGLTQQNELKPSAQVLGLVNQNIGDQMVTVERVGGSLRTFASRASADGTITLFIINKSDQPIATEFFLSGPVPQSVVNRTVYAGTSYLDTAPTLTTDTQATLDGNWVATTLPGISLTVLTVK